MTGTVITPVLHLVDSQVRYLFAVNYHNQIPPGNVTTDIQQPIVRNRKVPGAYLFKAKVFGGIYSRTPEIVDYYFGVAETAQWIAWVHAISKSDFVHTTLADLQERMLCPR